MYQKVVVRYFDGTTIRGFAEEFTPGKGSLIISPDGRPGLHLLVRLKDVKAVFFVKELYGNAERADVRGFGRGASGGGARVMVEFKDGEKLWGLMSSRTAEGAGWFFLYPTDQGGNNEKIFILREAVAGMHHN